MGWARQLALVLAVMVACLAGLTVTTQGQAHAFVGVVPVALTVVRTVGFPVARTVLPPTRMAWDFTGGFIAACLFTGEACTSPWKTDPGTTPDEPVPNSSGSEWVAPAGTPREAQCAPWAGGGQICLGQSGGTVTASWSGLDRLVGGPTGTTFKASTGCGQTVSAYLGGSGATTGALSLTDPDYPSVGCSTGFIVYGLSGATTLAQRYFCRPGDDLCDPDAGGERVQPSRQAQGWRQCVSSAGDFVYVAGPAFLYQEGQSSSGAPLPACPGSHPIPVGSGVWPGAPWEPGEVRGSPGYGSPDTQPLGPDGSPTGPVQPMPSPRVPPLYAPLPSTLLPLAPRPQWEPTPEPGKYPAGSPAGDPEVPTGPRPVPPGTPLQPLPEIGPDGAPLTDPATGQPVPQPRPPAMPDGSPCAWGGYQVDPDDCLPVGSPTTTPTAPPTPGPSPAPGDPLPRNDGQQDRDGCLSSSVTLNPITWVLEPVKCALRWAFVPSASTQTKIDTLQTEVGARAPVLWVRQIGGWVGTVLGSGAEGGCFVYDVHLGQLGSFHIIDSCASEAVPNAIRPLRPLLLVAVYAGFLGPLAWWAWRSYAPLSRPQG